MSSHSAQPSRLFLINRDICDRPAALGRVEDAACGIRIMLIMRVSGSVVAASGSDAESWYPGRVFLGFLMLPLVGIQAVLAALSVGV